MDAIRAETGVGSESPRYSTRVWTSMVGGTEFKRVPVAVTRKFLTVVVVFRIPIASWFPAWSKLNFTTKSGVWS